MTTGGADATRHATPAASVGPGRLQHGDQGPSPPTTPRSRLVVVVAAGSGRRPNELKWGHFAASRWDVAGDSRPEVLIGGEGLQRGPVPVLGTLLHEAAHGIASTRGVQETSRQGRYHNSAFRRLAIEVGLDVAQDGSHGWSHTTVPPATADRYRLALEELSAALVLWRRAEIGAGGAGSSRNPTACVCDCGRRLRASGRTLDEGPIIWLCDGEFRPEA